MATDPNPGARRPFDVQTIEHLIGLMAQHDLTEIALREGGQTIRLRKAGPAPVLTPAYPPPAHYPAAPANPGHPDPAPAGKKYHEIKSEMVGTFYSRPKPDKDDFVKVGARLKPDTTVCLIEAMKIFNEIKADIAGTVAEVCVKNGDPVDFGQVLFRVDTSA
ncbi:MAG TPA: acetyl-CoA carboxylase biotin carboxyl carrier protein [Fimbriiglobus sp.]|nr:acetyl-CoA carboxylase biotin carboxyl carrier protein [Fimbriiglobus sp.]